MSSYQENAEGLYQMGLENWSLQSFPKAIDFFQQAADLNHPLAHLQLGKCYEKGLYVDQSNQKAVFHYAKAADLDNLEAQVILGEAYCFKKLGLNKSSEKATEYFTLAANQKDLPTLLHLCKVCDISNSIAPEKKFLYAKMAAELNSGAGYALLANCYQYGIGIERSSLMALQHLEISAELGNSGAQYSLGVDYFEGLMGLPLNYKRAVYYLEKAAQQGHKSAQVLLADCYFDGLGTQKNFKKAFQLYKDSFKHDGKVVWKKLCQCYAKGRGVPKSIEMAFQVCKQAADNYPSETEAHYNTGRCYEYGIGINPSRELAVSYFKKAADFDCPNALERLAECYRTGDLTEPSEKLAVYYENKAKAYKRLSNLSILVPGLENE